MSFFNNQMILTTLEYQCLGQINKELYSSVIINLIVNDLYCQSDFQYILYFWLIFIKILFWNHAACSSQTKAVLKGNSLIGCTLFVKLSTSLSS